MTGVLAEEIAQAEREAAATLAAAIAAENELYGISAGAEHDDEAESGSPERATSRMRRCTEEWREAKRRS